MIELSFDFDSPPDPPAVPLPRELILASAGSGKTFRISSRIIGLLAHGARADTLFASTFTRKAAGEILDRVLTRMAEAAQSDAFAANLADEVTLGDASPRIPTDRGFWQELLERVVADLHRLNIGTLDAFFMRTARSFAHEIGLPPRWRIVDEPTALRMRSDALQDVLHDADPARIVEMMRGLERDAVTRSVHGRMLRDAADLVDIQHALDPTVPDPWGAFADAVGATPTPEQVRARSADIADALGAADVPATAAGKPHSGWQTAIGRCVEQVRAGAWDDLLGGKLCQVALGPPGSMYNRVVVPDELRAIFVGVRMLVRDVLAARYAAQGQAMGRLAALLAGALERRRREGGGYRFDDVTRLLGGPDALATRPDLYYRLDMRTQHLLLDEFQDTSLPQWEALEPLVDELLAGWESERAAVIVADPKQSIYGWRGASPLLVERVGERYALHRDVLAKSWRSSPVVLDVVNRIFADVDTLPVWRENEHAAAVARQWLKAFEPHRAEHEDRPGYVEVRVGPADESRSALRPELCRSAAELVKQLHTEAPNRSIGVLTRTNAAVARIMFELGQLGVEASEEGGVPLLDSAPVAAVLALLKLADHPADTLARYHVARTPLGEIVGFTEPGNDAAACRLAQQTRRRLLDDGYGATLAKLAPDLAAACDARERRRFAQLVELAFRYDAAASLRPTDFIRLVESERVEDASAAAVRVMTVHQAKGLEFDAVVLPQLDTPLAKADPKPLVLRGDDGAGRIVAVYPYVRDALRPLFASELPGLEAAAQQREAAVLRDSLSGLYVAVTRARHALYMIVPPDGKDRSGACTAAMLVRDALAPGERAVEGDVLCTHGAPDWAAQLDADDGVESTRADRAAAAAPETPVAASAAVVPAGSLPLLRPAVRRDRNLPRRSPSELEGGERVDIRNLLRIDAAASAQRGTAVHAWFEAIGWLEDGVPDDDELRSLARRAAPRMSAADVAALIARFHDWLLAPDVRAVLSRDTAAGRAAGDGRVGEGGTGSGDGGAGGGGTGSGAAGVGEGRAGSEGAGAGGSDDAILHVERELPFLRREGDVVMEGVIDRLVTREVGGVIAGADIIDFKTDAIDAGDADVLRQRLAFYRPQMDAYRRAVAAMYNVDEAVVRARLVFVEAGAVLDAHEGGGL